MQAQLLLWHQKTTITEYKYDICLYLYVACRQSLQVLCSCNQHVILCHIVRNKNNVDELSTAFLMRMSRGGSSSIGWQAKRMNVQPTVYVLIFGTAAKLVKGRYTHDTEIAAACWPIADRPLCVFRVRKTIWIHLSQSVVGQKRFSLQVFLHILLYIIQFVHKVAVRTFRFTARTCRLKRLYIQYM